MPKFLKLKKILWSLAVVSIAFLPIATTSFAKSAAAATLQTYEVQIAPGSSARIFSSDPTITKVRQEFPNSTDNTLAADYSIETAESIDAVKQEFGEKLLWVEPTFALEAGAVTVNDPGFTFQSNDVNRQWGLVKAHFTDAWSETTGNASVIVAVIDTGVDGLHEDLSEGQVIAGYNFLNNTIIPANTDSDDNGHGTLVAGVIGATANNFRGIAGTNWNVSIMPLKALDATGAGNSANIAAAISYAADHGATIINMSLGGTGFSNDITLANAVRYAYSKGVTLVAAAGNDVATDGGNMDLNPVFPVCDDNGQDMIIGVAATDDNDQKANFSNFGKSCVDVSAPGKRILSTISMDPTTNTVTHNGYAYADGTSLAAPFVAGEAALIRALYPNATNEEITYRIVTSADPIDNLNLTQCDNASCAGLIGNGRINASAALVPNLTANISDGSVVHAPNSAIDFYISGGQKHQISPFVLQQRFSSTTAKVVPEVILDQLVTGEFATPLDGTNVKASGSQTVYQMVGGIRRPITYQVLLQRTIPLSSITTVGDDELSSWLMGTFLPPAEGTLVRTDKNPTVYWVIDGLLHPINREFWIERGLNIFPIMIVSDADINSYALGDAYVR